MFHTYRGRRSQAGEARDRRSWLRRTRRAPVPLRLEALESRLAPACTPVTPPPVLTFNCDNANDSLQLTTDVLGNILQNGLPIPTVPPPTIVNTNLIQIQDQGGSDYIDLAGLDRYNGTTSINAGPGDDFVVGSPSQDRILGNQGLDVLIGYSGHDNICTNVCGAGPGAAGPGYEIGLGDGGPGCGDDTVEGSDFSNDVLLGGCGNDMMNGRGLDDVLLGEEGNDTLLGLDGIDVLLGQEGNDHLSGGGGWDYLNGGAGTDYYRPDPEDYIEECEFPWE